MCTQTFPKYSSSLIIKEKQKIFFISTIGPAHKNALAHGRFRPDPPSGGGDAKAGRLGASAHGRFRSSKGPGGKSATVTPCRRS
jgi:hypothetical protein